MTQNPQPTTPTEVPSLPLGVFVVETTPGDAASTAVCLLFGAPPLQAQVTFSPDSADMLAVNLPELLAGAAADARRKASGLILPPDSPTGGLHRG